MEIKTMRNERLDTKQNKNKQTTRKTQTLNYSNFLN